MKQPYKVGMLMVIGLSLIQPGCKSFILSDDDQKILDNSTQLLINEKQRVDRNIYGRLYNMHTNVVESGSRPKDIEEIHEALKLWQEYHQLSNSLSNLQEKSPEESNEEITFYQERMDVFGEEFRYKAEFPFREFPFYNNDHLNLELAYYGEYVIDKLSTRVGGHHPWFHMARLAVVQSENEVKVFVPSFERGDFVYKLSIPETFQDSLKFAELPPWTSIEYSSNGPFRLGISGESGDSIEVDLGYPVNVEIWN